jgi:hypothetical protein
MTHRINSAVNRPQGPLPHSPADRIGSKSQGEQLPARHHPVLVFRKVPHRTVKGFRSLTYANSA